MKDFLLALLTWLVSLFQKGTEISPSSSPKDPGNPQAPASEAGKPFDQGWSAGDREIAALTVWAEARGQPWEGQLAVAYVIRNRAEAPGWWGHGVAGVCQAPYQFSCWNAKVSQGSQRDRLMDVKTLQHPAMVTAMQAVDVAFAGTQPDPTHGATYYCTKAVVDKTSWARGKTPSAIIGAHVFFTKAEAERKA